MLSYETEQNLSVTIIGKALALGASLAGISSVQSIRHSPSHLGAKNVRWPFKAKAVIILALEHPFTEPSLDWWDGKQGTAGNRKLILITRQLKKWLKKNHGIVAHDVPYYIHKGGIFLKDSAACAAMGVIGKNNLLVTPSYGPRVRLRALFVNAQLTTTKGLNEFLPCENCEAPCIEVCPQNAFESGSYDRLLCQKQLGHDEKESSMAKNPENLYHSDSPIKYCRACELFCPVGHEDKNGESSN